MTKKWILLLVLLVAAVVPDAISQNYLKKKKNDIVKIELYTEYTGGIYPGALIPVKANVTSKKGKKTIGYDNWSKFQITVYGGSFRDGYVQISSNAKETRAWGHIVNVVVKDAKDTSVKANIVLRLNYKQNLVLTSKGEQGVAGENAKDRGTVLIGRDGTEGREGGIGGDGFPGPDIQTWVKYENEALLGYGLLNILVENKTTGQAREYLLNPSGGNLRINSKGGDGGTGGAGGSGSAGKDASEEKDKPGGDGGNGGNGGNGGTGGAGGNIVVVLDSTAAPYKHLVSAESLGGDGGTGGKGGEGGAGGKATEKLAGGKNGYNGENGQNGDSGKQSLLPVLISIEKITKKW